MTAPAPLVLIIEDEAQMRKFLRASLTSHDYRCIDADRGQLGLELARSHVPDVIMLDLGLPDMDGLEVTRSLRSWTSLPVIIISARGQENDKIAALDAGADDYLTKPFGTGELLARIRVALRHSARGAGVAGPVLNAGDIRIDFDKRLVFRDDEEVHLSPIEYKLLAMLMKNVGKVVTHRQLLREVWGPSHATETQYLRVYMGQLRHKLEREPARPRYLLTEPGVGYRLKAE
jgi:two-component system, OmpR family, KDP operon response regulator KdpE